MADIAALYVCGGCGEQVTQTPNEACPSCANQYRHNMQALMRLYPRVTAAIHERARGDGSGSADVGSPVPFNVAAFDTADAIERYARRVTRGVRGAWDGVPDRLGWAWANPRRVLRDLPLYHVRAVGALVARAGRLLDDDPAPELVGFCGACGHPLRARRGAAAVTCRGCGGEYNAAGLDAVRKHWRDRASNLAMTAADAARAATIATGREIKPDTVTKWIKRGHVARQSADFVRVGDVIEHAERVAKDGD